jgi:hypothetical protein
VAGTECVIGVRRRPQSVGRSRCSEGTASPIRWLWSRGEQVRATRPTRFLVRRLGLWWFLAVLAVYPVATLVVSYPVPFRLGTVIPGVDSHAADYCQHT